MKFSKTHPWVIFQKQCSIAYRKTKDLQQNKIKRLKTPKSHATKGLKTFHNKVSNIERKTKSKRRQRKLDKLKNIKQQRRSKLIINNND